MNMTYPITQTTTKHSSSSSAYFRHLNEYVSYRPDISFAKEETIQSLGWRNAYQKLKNYSQSLYEESLDLLRLRGGIKGEISQEVSSSNSLFSVRIPEEAIDQSFVFSLNGMSQEIRQTNSYFNYQTWNEQFHHGADGNDGVLQFSFGESPESDFIVDVEALSLGNEGMYYALSELSDAINQKALEKGVSLQSEVIEDRGRWGANSYRLEITSDEGGFAVSDSTNSAINTLGLWDERNNLLQESTYRYSIDGEQYNTNTTTVVYNGVEINFSSLDMNSAIPISTTISTKTIKNTNDYLLSQRTYGKVANFVSSYNEMVHFLEKSPYIEDGLSRKFSTILEKKEADLTKLGIYVSNGLLSVDKSEFLQAQKENFEEVMKTLVYGSNSLATLTKKVAYEVNRLPSNFMVADKERNETQGLIINRFF
jgi:hypothetical protein